MWCIAELDQAYIQKMEDVLAVYEKPYNPAQPVVCLDEKPISLHADVRAPIPAKPGKLAKQDNEYQRCGTANVFGVVEPKGGRHFTTATPNRCGAEFARMVERVVEQYPAADTIHLVMDNLNIHCRKSLTDCFGEQKGGAIWDRLSVHYAPKHGSWLDQADRPTGPAFRRFTTDHGNDALLLGAVENLLGSRPLFGVNGGTQTITDVAMGDLADCLSGKGKCLRDLRCGEAVGKLAQRKRSQDDAYLLNAPSQ